MSAANAVLPPSTGWGFQIQDSSSASQINNASHFAFGSSTPLSARSSAKRKLSSPECIDVDLESDSDSATKYSAKRPTNPSTFMSNVAFPETSNYDSHLLASSSIAYPQQHRKLSSRIRKRARVQGLTSRPLPVSRLVETIDRLGLENLITTLCNSRPDLAHEIIGLAPKITVTSALDTLSNRLDTVFRGLPYKGDQQGDYAYLRVKPAVDDFLSALTDYMAHFLPPNEPRISNSLAFLDGATSLLHRLPTWTNPLNNHSKNTMYEEVSQAWVLTLTEASQQSNGLGLAYGGWAQKLAHHNELANNSLSSAVSMIRQEMTWDDSAALLKEQALISSRFSNSSSCR